MRLIIDANILLAAFLKSAFIRELLFDDEIELFAPGYFAIEVSKTLRKSKFLKIKTVLGKEDIEEAKQHIPQDDAPYLVLSLAIKIPIWSNDSAFKRQNLARVYTTQEIIKLLGY